MSFKVMGAYEGPGHYAASLADGIFASFAHSDVQSLAFASVPTTDCNLCINDDGLSGTVTCWGLETPTGSSPRSATSSTVHSPARARRRSRRTQRRIPPPQGLANGAILCHYLGRLDCPGRPADADCISRSQTCPVEWNVWLGCIEDQRPSGFRCGAGGDELTTTNGACATQRTALDACRARTTGTGGGAGGGGSAGSGGAGGAGGAPMRGTIGPRCTDCMPACSDINNELGYPDATCTAPSPLAGIANRFDLVATLPDGSKRYLTAWPFDSGSEFSWSWSADSLGARTFTQKLRCGTVSMSGVPTGTATASGSSGPRLSITIDGVAYTSLNAPASVTLTAPQPLGSPTWDQDWGPLFDFRVSGTLVASTGASIGIDGRMRNTFAGNGERGLGRRDGAIGGPGMTAPGLTVSGDRLILATVLMGNGPAPTSNMLSLDLALGSDRMVPLPDTVFLQPFPDGTFLAMPSNSYTWYLASYDAAATTVRWKTPTIMRTSLNLGGMIARNDGSGCLFMSPGSFPIDIYPSVMTCTDASGTPLWQKSIYPVGQPRVTELADGTLVVADMRTPEVMGLRPNGDKRFEIVPCLSNPTTDRLPFYKTSGVARNASGGAVAQIGDDVISFSADGQIQWRVLLPRGDSEPLVAADGTVYAMSAGPAYVVALGAGGAVRWTRLVGGSGQLIGLAADGTIYVQSYGPYSMYALSALRADGTIAWSISTDTQSWLMAPGGDLYGWSKDSVDRVKGDSPMSDSPWPTIRGSARRAGTR